MSVSHVATSVERSSSTSSRNGVRVRVLHFYKDYLPTSTGGIEQTIFQICEAGAGMGIESKVLSLAPQGRGDERKIGQHRSIQVKRNFQIASTGFSTSVFEAFKRAARNVDVIHYHYPWPFMDVVHFATRVPKPTVVTYHSDVVRQKWLFQLYKPLQQRFLASVDRIVATSPNYAKHSPVLQKFRNKVDVVPIGLDRASYPRATAKQINYWQQRLPERFFLFVGVLRYYKGLHILIEAARRSGLPVVIAGAGPCEQELRQSIQKSKIDNVHMVGRIPEEDKVALQSLCDAVVLPSHLRSEAFGVSLLEGAMVGKPMISCEIGTGTSFVNLDGQTGLVIDPNNPEQLAQAMKTLWDDPPLAKTMGDAAESRFSQCFTAQKMVAQYAGIYEDVMAQRRTR